ncbi:hypothetical protein AVM02_04725 [Brucella anthropi]
MAFILVLLVNRRRFTGRSAKVDKFLGDLAYPMFLGHYVFAFASLQILGLNEHRGWIVFWIGATATIAASTVIVICVDYRIDGFRKSIKASADKRRSLKTATA